MESYTTTSLRAAAMLWAAAFMAMIALGSISSSGIRSFGGCMEEEMNGLLLLKAAFNISATSDFLSSWNPNRSNSDCYCSWEGVVCSNLNRTAMRRVTQLSLNSYSSSQNYWYLNASIFRPFEELQVLDLSDNLLDGVSGTLRLKKLQSLNLSYNYGLNPIPNLAELPSLKEVYLSYNNIKSLHPLQGLKLEVLDLEWASAYDPEYNTSIIWEMTSLKALSLAYNSLNSPFEDLCGLVNLEELDISDNLFNGLLPPCLGNMTSLRALDIRNNYFGGIIPGSFFSGLGFLEFISLSGNYFQGSLSLANAFGNTSKLEVFELKDNFDHQLNIETENPLYSPLSQMKSFRISNCFLNKPSGYIFPSFLLRQHELRELELSRCGILGDFPNWLLGNNSHLGYLNLRSNSISGNLDFNYSSSTHLDLSVFDISSNRVGGKLPSNISSIFPELDYLNMSNNVLQGSILSLGHMISLLVLDLSSNNFIGELPPETPLISGSEWSISVLKLSDNYLSGKLPLSLSANSLDCLYLDNNYFTGDISPVLLNNSMFLRTLDISNNLLTGAVPHSIGDLQYLQYLILSNNLLKGRLPLSFCKLNLVFLDLSSNDFGPDIPPICTNISLSLSHLYLRSTNLRGSFPNFLRGASSMETLDLRGNALSGTVPSWIGSLLSLRILVLEGNNFDGTIPRQICQLNKLSILDLSANQFSGGIPLCLNTSTFGDSRVGSNSLGAFGYGGGVSGESGYHSRKLSLGSITHRTYITSDNFGEVKFLTKNRLETYKGSILDYMSGLDLSNNNLSGSIPIEIGWLTGLHALNLSHNYLTGSIPTSFSNLKEIESLDLSHNTLNGEIPPQLTELFRLSVFSVAHNNLSARMPDWKNQFSTFNRTCYEGNPFLCGPPLESCRSSEDPSPEHSETEENPFKDVFWWSSAGSYLMAFIVTIVILYLTNYYNTPGFFIYWL